MTPLLVSRPRVGWYVSAAVNVVCDGNSIVDGGQDGSESVDAMSGYLKRHIRPFNAQGHVNVAIGGQTTDDADGDATDVDAAFVDGKVNILIYQDGTNQGYAEWENETPNAAQVTVDKTFAYFEHRLADRAWDYLVCVTVPPVYRGDQADAEEQAEVNALYEQINALMKAQWRGAGLHACIDTRSERGPCAQSRYPNYDKATFFSTSVVDSISNDAFWITEPDDGPVPDQKIHYTAAGIALMAERVWAPALLRLPKA